MAEDRTEFKPFGVECRARHCRLAFLVDSSKCPPELLDSLFDANYGLWGGRFNPIIPVQDGEIGEEFWSLLTYADPDLVYSYTQLKQSTVDRIDREIVPWRIEAHPPHLFESHPQPHYHPHLLDELVKSRQVLPLLIDWAGNANSLRCDIQHRTVSSVPASAPVHASSTTAWIASRACAYLPRKDERLPAVPMLSFLLGSHVPSQEKYSYDIRYCNRFVKVGPAPHDPAPATLRQLQKAKTSR
jgi:hypothetical protein